MRLSVYYSISYCDIMKVFISLQSIIFPENGNMLTLELVWNLSFVKKGQCVMNSLNNQHACNSNGQSPKVVYESA
ncbi:hypothetical protein IX332_001048 [Porphyromonas levii]|nr:hypothetical protein [Porphyromonas levii]MBR8714151.1 hypothetical protein [Porphyromonas levii]MBR8716144.1 hypothetical protein [Porphyromonas levii]MBR8728678.1 hypothetical protein [Porphyromonas levii]MBR8729725.1 hypothetical protein [Porphyromonas levii]